MTNSSEEALFRRFRPYRAATAMAAWVSVTVLVSAAPSHAARGHKRSAACASAYDAAQEHEWAGRLREAQAFYLACFRPTCSAAMQKRCLERYVLLDAEIPTVLPIATDQVGEALVDVQVRVDGGLLASRIDGRAFPVDPGAHQFSFATDRGIFATQNLTILQGERDRRICASETSTAAPLPSSNDAASADDTPASSASSDLDLRVQVASAYVFRGYNVFQSASQRDQNMALLARLIWSVPRTDLSVGYSTVYQMTGDNLSHNIQVGLGAEQVAFVDYDLQPTSNLTITPEIAAMVYPIAQDVPLFLEASVEGRYTAPVDISLYAGYFAAVREGPLSESHFYVRPIVEKDFDITKELKVSMEAGAGVKIFQSNPGSIHSNMFDFLSNAAFAYSFTPAVYVGAGFGVAWTNLGPHEDPATGQMVAQTLRDEYVPVANVNAGGEW